MFNFENTKTSRKWAIILFALFSAFVFGAMFFGLSSQTKTSASDVEEQSSKTEQTQQSSQSFLGSSDVEKKWDIESGAVLGAALTDDGTFLFSVANCQYNGSAQEPAVTITDTATGETLTSGTDFLTQYSNNTNAGRGQVVVTGQGDYTGGSVTLDFDILPVDLSNGSITFTSQSFTYNGQHQAPEITFALDGFTVTESDYTVYYRTSVGTSTNNTTAIDAGTYYVEVRGKAQDDPQYTPGSSYTPGGNFYGSVVNTTTSFSIGQMPISSTGNVALDGVTLTLDNTTFNYDGNAHTPKITAFTVNVGGSTHQVTNYAVTYINSGNQTLDASQVIAPGDYTMRVTVGASGGNFSGTIDRTFRIEQRDLGDSSFTKEYNPSSLSFVYNGISQVPTVIIRDVLSQVVPSSAYTITYAQGGTSLTAEEIINVGTYTMTVTGNSAQGYTGSFSQNFTITAASITDFEPSFSLATYNGEPQVPTIDGVTCAVSGATYDISTSGNTTNAGSYTLTLKGTGNFTGTISKTITINKYNISSAKISLSETSFTYDGQVHKPTVTLKVNSNDFVISSDEYDITYSTDCISAGSVTVSVSASQGATNITGTSPSTTFNIAPKSLVGNVTFSSIADQTYNGSEISPAFTVTDTARNVPLTSKDYEIVSYTSSNSSDATGHTDVGTVTITIKGKGNYDVNTTATTTFQIVAKTFSNSGEGATVTTTPNAPTYTGKAITLSNDLQVSVSDIALGALTYGQDYTLDISKGTSGYSNNTNAGTNTAVVYFKGLNNYSGEISVNFTINKKDISGATASVSGTYTYNGSAQSIVTSISLDDFTNDDVTYSRTFYNSGGSEISSAIVNAGNYSVTLTGTGNFTGTTAPAQFTVGQFDITNETLTVVASGDTTYTGSEITLQVTSVTTSGGLTVTYTTDYQNNIEAGDKTATILITGTGNFKGTNSGYKFTIAPRPLNTFGAITIDSTNSTNGTVDVVYKGSPFTPSNLAIYDNRGTSYVLDGNLYSLKITKTGDDNEYTSLTDEGLNWQSVGTITIVATPTSTNYSGTSTITVNIASMELTESDVVLTLTTDDIIYNGTQWQPTFTLALSSTLGGTAIAENEFTHTYSNNVNASTQAEINITFQNGYTGTITKYFTIAERNISNVNIATITNPTYDGQSHKITPTVTDVITSDSIITSADYVLTYEYSQNGSTDWTSATDDQDFVNAGYYRITLTGQKNYTGTKQTTYQILQANLSTTTVSAISPIEFDNQVHNADNIHFTITLGSGQTAVVLDETQYIVAGYQVSSNGAQDGSYSSVTSPQNAGYYRIVLNGQNNFTGTHYAYFEITRKNITDDETFSLSPGLITQTYTGNQITQQITYVVWSTHSLNIPINNFDVVWGDNVNAGTNAGSVTITGKTSSNYQGSKTFYFDIEAKDISTGGLTSNSNTPVYTGSAITINTGLTFSVLYSGKSLNLGTDYEVDTAKGTNGYDNNTNAGTNTATIYIKGINNFKGETSFTFSIAQANINGAVVNGVTDKVYTGSAITQSFTVMFNSAQLTQDVDYSVEYENNLNVGRATITLTGMGTNFLSNSTKTINFNITAKTLTADMVSVGENVTFNGTAQAPSVTISDDDAQQAMTSSDYQITYTYSQTEAGTYGATDEFVNAGYYRITVTGKGNYTTGSSPVVKTYQILQMNIATVEYDEIANLTYNKQVQKPTPTGLNIDLSANGGSADVVLNEGVDYTVSYNGADYTNAEQKQITITGQGNYTGTATIDYTIDQKALENDWINGASASYVFSNEDNKPEISVIWGGDTVATSNYTVSYLRYTGSEHVTANPGESTNVGQYRISVSANAESQNYTGTATFDYVITPAILEAVSLDNLNATYNQAKQAPTIQSVVTENGIGNSSNLDSMFTISYEYRTTELDDFEDVVGTPEFINAGYYRITVAGKAESASAVTGDNYFGSVSVVYQIIAKDINTLKDQITFYFGYYAGADNTITYTNGENPEEIVQEENRVAMGDAQTYRGQRVVPEILDSENVDTANILVRGTDYTFTFPSDDYISAGEVVLSIAGTGNYQGTYIVRYNVNPATFSPERVGTLDVYEIYTGEKITLSEENLGKLLYDIDNSNVAEETYAYLKFGTDFQITTFEHLVTEYPELVTEEDLAGIEDRNTYYFNNINAGVAVVALEGLGSFTGGMIVEFHISPRSIETYAGEFEFALPSDFEVIYDRAQQRPTLDGGTATYTYNSGTPTPLVQDVDYTLDYGNNITVAEGGTIIIKGTGNFTGERTIEFDITPYDISSLTPSHAGTAVYDGLPHEPVFTITYVDASLQKDTDFTYTCMFTAEDSGSSVPTTSYIEAGTYVFTIKGQGNFTGEITNVKYTISASALAKILVNDQETLIQVVYNGTAQAPTIVVKNGKDETLVLTKDYTLSYQVDTGSGYGDEASPSEPDWKDVKKVRITATGAGNYDGSVYAEFEITPKPISDEDITITINANKTYNGAPQALMTGEITVQFGSDTLAQGASADYEIVYPEDITNAGEKTITIYGRGNFGGNIEKSYTIQRKAFTFGGDSDTITITQQGTSTYRGTAITLNDGLTLAIRDIALDRTINASNYEVNTSEGTNGYSANTNAGQATIYLKGTESGNYVGDVTFKFTISPKSIADSSINIPAVTAKAFTGETITPTLTVTDTLVSPDTPLVAGEESGATGDYYLTYGANTNAGTEAGSIVVHGRGNYSGTQTVYFDILAQDLSDSTQIVIGTIEAQVFTGFAITPTPTVTWTKGDADEENDVTLIANQDFTYSYDKNTNAGQATLTITFVEGSNYTGSQTTNFTINAADIKNTNIQLSENSFEFDNADHMPTLTITLGSGEQVYTLQSSDYEIVEPTDKKNFGQKTITINAQGTNFTGTTTASYQITAKELTADMISGISNDSVATYTGKEITFDFTITDSDINYTLSSTGNIVDFTYAYDNNTNVTLSEGQVIAGATLTITPQGNYKGSPIVITFKIDQAEIDESMVATIVDQGYTGNKITLPNLILTFNSVELNVAENFATQYANNEEVSTDEQQASITITADNDKNANFTGSFTKYFKIVQRTVGNLDDFDVTISTDGTVSGTYFYKGTAWEPKVTLKEKTTGAELMEGTDFDVDYENNINAGEATIKITFTSSYSGTATTTFTISPLDLSEVDIDEISNIPYDGDNHQVNPVIRIDGTLISNEFYSVEYQRNSETTSDFASAGTITVVITPKSANGITNFTGSTSTTYTIDQQDINASSVVAEVTGKTTYTGEQLQPTFTLTFGEMTLDTDDYTITSYGNNTTVAEGGTITIAGKGNYVGTKVITFTIEPAILTPEMADYPKSVEYTGQELEPEVTITFNDKKLEKDKDFSVEYQNNKDISTNALIIITGLENFAGSNFNLNFEIVARSYNNENIRVEWTSSVENLIYTGSAITPEYNVYYTPAGSAEVQLEANQDFKGTFSENINAGEATLTIEGLNGAGGSATVHFTINKAELSTTMFTSLASKEFTGQKITFDGSEITGTYLGKPLVFEQDFIITGHGDNINVLDGGTVIVEGQGNFTKSVTLEFSITPKEITSVALSQNNVTFKGSAYELTVYVYAGGSEAIESTNYSITYETLEGLPLDEIDLTNAGTTVIVVKASGNYSGQKTANFTIGKKSIAEQDITVTGIVSKDYNYGQEVVQDRFTVLFGGSIQLKPEIDFTVDYRNNTNAGQATMILTGNGNYEGVKNVSFEINKIDPTIHPFVENITYYEDDDLPEILLQEGDTAGTFTPQDATTLIAGTNQYRFLFVPTDQVNYNSITARVEITAEALIVESLEITGLKDEYFAYDIFDTTDMQITAIWNNGNRVVVPDGEYTLNLKSGQELTVDDTSLIVTAPNYSINGLSYELTINPVEITINYGDLSNIVEKETEQTIGFTYSGDIEGHDPLISATYFLNGSETGQTAITQDGQYTIKLVTDNKNYVITNPETTFNVITGIITSDDENVTIISDTGFEADITVTIRQVTSEEEMAEIIGDLSGLDIERVYVVEMFKNGERYVPTNNITVRIVADNRFVSIEGLQVYDKDANSIFNPVEFTINAEDATITLTDTLPGVFVFGTAQEGTPGTWWIYLAVGVAVAVIIVLIIISRQISRRNRRRRARASGTNSINNENNNDINNNNVQQ